MALEDITAGSTIADLNTANPVTGDPISQGDDHLRNLKKAIKQTYPNVDSTVSASPAELDLAHKGGTISGSLVVMSDLSVVGAATMKGNLSVSGNLAIGGTAAFTGAVTGAGAKFDTLTVSATTIANRLVVNGNAHFSATISGSVKEADYARSAGFAHSASEAGSALWANSAQYAVSSAVADYAKSAGAVTGRNFRVGVVFASATVAAPDSMSSTQTLTGHYTISHGVGEILYPWVTGSSLRVIPAVIALSTVRTTYVLYKSTSATDSARTSVAHYLLLMN